MIIETKFNMHQRLWIADVGPCRVIRITLSGQNLLYDVEYWNGGELKTVTLYEDSLCLSKDAEKVVGIV